MTEKPPVLHTLEEIPVGVQYPRPPAGSLFRTQTPHPWWFYVALLSLVPIPVLGFLLGSVGLLMAYLQILKNDTTTDPQIVRDSKTALPIAFAGFFFGFLVCELAGLYWLGTMIKSG